MRGGEEYCEARWWTDVTTRATLLPLLGSHAARAPERKVGTAAGGHLHQMA